MSRTPKIYSVEIHGVTYPAMRVSTLLGKKASYNPRRISDHDKEKLKKSLERFGAVQSVVFNKRTGTIVGGHQRLEAADSAGLELFPVMIVDLSEAEEKTLNLSLNRIGGEFDWQAVSDMLVDLNEKQSEFLDLSGFTQDEITPLLTAEFRPTIDDGIPGDPTNENSSDSSAETDRGITFDEFLDMARSFVESPEPSSMVGDGEESKSVFHEAVRNALDQYDAERLNEGN